MRWLGDKLTKVFLLLEGSMGNLTASICCRLVVTRFLVTGGTLFDRNLLQSTLDQSHSPVQKCLLLHPRLHIDALPFRMHCRHVGNEHYGIVSSTPAWQSPTSSLPASVKDAKQRLRISSGEFNFPSSNKLSRCHELHSRNLFLEPRRVELFNNFQYAKLFASVTGTTQKPTSVLDVSKKPSEVSNFTSSRRKEYKIQSSSERRNIRRLRDARVVWSICIILREGTWGPGAVYALDQLRIRLRAKQVNRVIRRVKTSDVALHFFHWAGVQPSFKHSTFTYNAMIERLGAAQNVEAQCKLLQDMHKQGLQMNVATFNILIVSFSRAKNTTGVLDTLNRMPKYGCTPNSFTFKCVIRSLIWNGHVQEATLAYKQMLHFSFVPDNFTYNGLVDGLCKAGKLDDACRIFRDMEVHAHHPDAFAHKVLIRGLHAVGQVDESLTIFDGMRKKGLCSNFDTYQSLIGCTEEVEPANACVTP